ncbi:MAG: hypothetical protein ABEL04_08915 [Salinibacter sp.]|uniref:hypothetical protein n=1 Tax=Salinibacter sp. TaxID=2065818 RepID=UPI0035D478BC
MSITLVVKGFDDRHVSESNFSLGVIWKLGKPAPKLILLVYIRRRKWVLATESQVDLLTKPFGSLSPLSTIAILGNVISRFVDRCKRQQQGRPFIKELFELIEHLLPILTEIRHLKNVAEDGSVDDANAH